jgi:hypothetical protein
MEQTMSQHLFSPDLDLSDERIRELEQPVTDEQFRWLEENGRLDNGKTYEENRKTTTHTFQPGKYTRGFCAVCKQAVWHANHPPIDRAAIDAPKVQSFPGMETADADRAAAKGLAQADELSAQLRRPLTSISAKAGKMERDSPLFFGLGDNPILF